VVGCVFWGLNLSCMCRSLHRRLFHQFVCPIIEQNNREGRLQTKLRTSIPFHLEECQKVEAAIENFSSMVCTWTIRAFLHLLYSCIRCILCTRRCVFLKHLPFYCTAVLRKRATSPLRPHTLRQPKGRSLQTFGRGQSESVNVLYSVNIHHSREFGHKCIAFRLKPCALLILIPSRPWAHS
jgi:hypothetical protein